MQSKRILHCLLNSLFALLNWDAALFCRSCICTLISSTESLSALLLSGVCINVGDGGKELALCCCWCRCCCKTSFNIPLISTNSSCWAWINWVCCCRTCWMPCGIFEVAVAVSSTPSSSSSCCEYPIGILASSTETDFDGNPILAFTVSDKLSNSSSDLGVVWMKK